MENQLHTKMAVFHSYLRRCIMESAAECGLLPGQPKVLEYLARHPGCTPKDIRIAWNADKSTLSGIISRMERDGLLTMKEASDDKRRKTLTITDKGQRIYDKLQYMIEQVDKKATEGISMQEMEFFYSISKKIENNLKDFHTTAIDYIEKEI